MSARHRKTGATDFPEVEIIRQKAGTHNAPLLFCIAQSARPRYPDACSRGLTNLKRKAYSAFFLSFSKVCEGRDKTLKKGLKTAASSNSARCDCRRLQEHQPTQRAEFAYAAACIGPSLTAGRGRKGCKRGHFCQVEMAFRQPSSLWQECNRLYFSTETIQLHFAEKSRGSTCPALSSDSRALAKKQKDSNSSL